MNSVILVLGRHPQYAAFYKWLEHDFGADAVLHFGMHGTVEWVRWSNSRPFLPSFSCIPGFQCGHVRLNMPSAAAVNVDMSGSICHLQQQSYRLLKQRVALPLQLPGAPLGNSGLSWSDVLLSSMPNIYVYAANNPSESIIAKRRGYGTIISHNVPPYGRCGGAPSKGFQDPMEFLRLFLANYQQHSLDYTVAAPVQGRPLQAAVGAQVDAGRGAGRCLSRRPAEGPHRRQPGSHRCFPWHLL